MHCARMVSQVHIFFLATGLGNLWHLVCHSTQMHHPTSWSQGRDQKPSFALSHWDSNELWDNHTARTLGQLQDCGGHLGEYFFNLLLGVCLTMVLNALANYNSFPMSWYSQSPHTGSLTPAYQRHIQGPCCHLGRTIHQGDPPCSSGKQDTCRYWQMVHFFLSHSYFQCQPFARLLQCCHSQDCITSTRVVGSSSGHETILRG